MNNKQKLEMNYQVIEANIDFVLESLGVVPASKDDLFEKAWDYYHSLSGMPKTDRAAAEKHFKKLTLKEKRKVLDSIPLYIGHCRAKDQYMKKFRTYIADKNFNDEYNNPMIFHA